MATKIKITKTDDKNFNVNFSEPVKGPNDTPNGGEIPVQWLHGMLDYHQRYSDPKKGLSTAHRKIAPW